MDLETQNKTQGITVQINIELRRHKKPYIDVTLKGWTYLTYNGDFIVITDKLPYKYLINEEDGRITLSQSAIVAEVEKRLFEGQTSEEATETVKDEIKAEINAVCVLADDEGGYYEFTL